MNRKRKETPSITYVIKRLHGSLDWNAVKQSPTMNNENSSSPSANTDIQTFLGRHIYVNNNQFFVESILGQGGFAYVFLVRSTYYHQQRYALKRMYVNNQRDLSVCVREIDLLKEFSSHKNIVKYVDSSIRCLRPRTFTNRQYQAAQRTKDYDDEDDSIYEILLLTEFCTQGSLVVRRRFDFVFS